MSTTTRSSGGSTTSGPPPERLGLAVALRGYVRRLRGGDIGGLPAILGFLVLVAFFSVMRPDTFATKLNAANLINQSAAIIFIAMGLVFVLLLGQIDLSAGFAAGTSGATLAVLLSRRDLPLPVAVIGCLATGVVIGLLIGLLVARLGIPSFVVTLAAFLGLQGVMLYVIGEGGTIAVRDSTIQAIMNSNVPPLIGWLIVAVVVVGYAVLSWRTASVRLAAGLPAASTGIIGAKVVALAVLLGSVTFVLNQERSINPSLTSLRGMPLIVPIGLVVPARAEFSARPHRFRPARLCSGR